MKKSILRWAGIIVLTTLASLSAIPLVPIAVLCARRVTIDPGGLNATLWRLPRWARWLETHDDMDGLLPGGMYESAIANAYKRHGWRWASIRWLWRNRAYRFTARFQFRADADTAIMDARGRFDVGANGPGLLRVRLDDAGRTAWEWYYVRRLWGERGIRVRLGYKLQPLVRTPREMWPDGPHEWARTAIGLPVLFVSPCAKVAG
jgi:hypothetical protein